MSISLEAKIGSSDEYHQDDSFAVPVESRSGNPQVPMTPLGPSTPATGQSSPRTPDEKLLHRCFSPPIESRHALAEPHPQKQPIQDTHLAVSPREEMLCQNRSISDTTMRASRSASSASSSLRDHSPVSLPAEHSPTPYISEASSVSAGYRKASAGYRFRSQGCVDLHNTRDRRSLSGLLNALSRDQRVCTTASSLDGGMKDGSFGAISGIHVTTLIECCAANLKSSVADANHVRSASGFPVDHLDDFISHSWRASRWLKYFALVLIYNNEAALVMCAIASMITFALWEHLPNISDRSPIKSYCCGVGFFVYFLGVQCYQRVRQLFRLRLNTAFLDKLCIDQTDEESMRNGISRLSFFLVNSKRMVILWDRTYFTRAWCVFEVAVREHFFKVHGNDDHTNIVLVPLQLACIVSMLCLSVWVSSAALLICLNLEVDDLLFSLQRITTMGFATTSSLFCGTCAAMIGRQYARDKRHLKDELLQFSWEGAKCQDPRDYEAISMLLLHWFGSICEFDMYVSGEFRQRVLQQLGGKDGLRLKFTLPVCMAVFCCILDFVAYTTHVEPRDAAGHISLWLFFFTASFVVVPLIFKIFLRLCGALQVQRSWWLADAALNLSVWLLTILCIVPAIGVPALLDRLYFSRNEIIWFLLQIVLDLALIIACAWHYKDSIKNALSGIRGRLSSRISEDAQNISLPTVEHLPGEEIDEETS